MPERLVNKEQLEMALKIISITPREFVEDIYLKNAKLGQYEEIEEELGINLDTFIKVLKSKNLVGRFNKYGQYDKKAIRKLRNIKLDIIKKRFLADDYGWVINIPLNFNKYGKTWATTKEELL